jgi:hypothetical protein
VRARGDEKGRHAPAGTCLSSREETAVLSRQPAKPREPDRFPAGSIPRAGADVPHVFNRGLRDDGEQAHQQERGTRGRFVRRAFVAEAGKGRNRRGKDHRGISERLQLLVPTAVVALEFGDHQIGVGVEAEEILGNGCNEWSGASAGSGPAHARRFLAETISWSIFGFI